MFVDTVSVPEISAAIHYLSSFLFCPSLECWPLTRPSSDDHHDLHPVSLVILRVKRIVRDS